MTYLFVDTNIYIQCCLLELEGDDLNTLQKLRTLLTNKKIKLLLPEVVELEFYRILEQKSDELKKKVGVYKEYINKDNNFDSKIKADLLKKLDECIKEREDNTIKVKKEIEKIFKEHTIKIEMTNDDIINASRLALSGKKPSKEKHGIIQQDCMIIEALKRYLKDKASYTLYICSANKHDFAKNGKEKDENCQIHDDIRQSFTNVEYYVNLFRLLNEKFGASYTKETIDKLEEEAASCDEEETFRNYLKYYFTNRNIFDNNLKEYSNELKKVWSNESLSCIHSIDRNFLASINELIYHYKKCKMCDNFYDSSNRIKDDGLCDNCRRNAVFNHA